MSAPRAERKANGYLTGASLRLREQQTSDIGAPDQKHQRDSTEKNPEAAARSADRGFFEWFDYRGPVGVRGWITAQPGGPAESSDRLAQTRRRYPL